ncbi:hypothetical protein BYT27DRAFT_6497481 [Phlegmacium glaucopus]|nr:hypothetical protein BYT27DRAFT_6497481 [Phlegmacium glaucopus]
MVYEHELQILAPLESQPEFESQPESQMSHYFSETYTLPPAVQEFRDMFEGRSDLSDEDLSQISDVLQAASATSFEGCQMIKKVEKQQLDHILPSSSPTACAFPQAASTSPPAPTLSSSDILKDSKIPTTTTQQVHNTMTPQKARKRAAQLSRELLVIDSLQKRTRKLYCKMLILSRG